MIYTEYIYTISCPVSELVVYVGKTQCPERRLYQHCLKSTKTRIGRWCKAMISIGLRPLFKVIDETEGDISLLEQAYVRHYLNLNQAVHNVNKKTLYLYQWIAFYKKAPVIKICA